MGFRQRKRKSKLEGSIESTQATVHRRLAVLARLEADYDGMVAEANLTPEEAEAARVRRDEVLAAGRGERLDLERQLALMEEEARAKGLRAA